MALLQKKKIALADIIQYGINIMKKNLKGADGNDRIVGNWWSENIYGEGGDDQLYGNNGNDTIYGQEGNDYLNGGADNDKTIWRKWL